MDPLAIIIVTAQISAAFALFVGITSSIAQAKIASVAIESIARQPAAGGSITNTMFISLAMAETNGIYGLLIAIILLFANPLVNVYLQNIS
jgi:F-type H+-transporting ATPase subunit c